jgi:hypothetical protein
MDLITYGVTTLEACIRDLRARIADAITSKLIHHDDADLLLVQPSTPERIWLCAIRRSGVAWRVDAVEIPRPHSVDTGFALPELEPGEQEQHLLASYQSFRDLFVPWAQYADPQAASAVLRVKVDPNELWFLRFPLGLFVQMKFDGFRQYSGCQWIVTHRSISSTVAAQQAAEREMADTRGFLNGAHIIINTYAAHENAQDAIEIARGVELVLDILKQFASIRFGDETATLRWTLNPPPDALAAILRSPETHFLFADFEAADGTWHIGDGPHYCCQPCHHPPRHQGESTFGLGPFRDGLAHIRLVRIYHCNSIYNPFRPALPPAAENTLAGQLLATGALFVEGSGSAETALDFICELLNLFLGRSDLKTILWARSVAGLCDLDTLLQRANALLAARGFAALSNM